MKAFHLIVASFAGLVAGLVVLKFFGEATPL